VRAGDADKWQWASNFVNGAASLLFLLLHGNISAAILTQNLMKSGSFTFIAKESLRLTD
jgi:hypothetical protein